MFKYLPDAFTPFIFVFGIIFFLIITGFILYVLFILLAEAFKKATIKWKRRYDRSQKIIIFQATIIKLLKDYSVETQLGNLDKMLEIEKEIKDTEQQIIKVSYRSKFN